MMTFLVNETTFKVVVITSSVVNMIFLLADTSFLVTKVTFVVAEIRFKEAVITSSVAKFRSPLWW